MSEKTAKTDDQEKIREAETETSAAEQPIKNKRAKNSAQPSGKKGKSRDRSSEKKSVLNSLVEESSTGLDSASDGDDSGGELDSEGFYKPVRLKSEKKKELPPAGEDQFTMIAKEREAQIFQARSALESVKAKTDDIRAKVSPPCTAEKASKAVYTEEELNALVEEHLSRLGVDPVPRHEMREGMTKTEADADYAMRMDAWEKRVIEEGEKRLHLESVNKRTGIDEGRTPLRTGTDSTLGGYPTPVPVREWSQEGSTGATTKYFAKLKDLDPLLKASLALLLVVIVSAVTSLLTSLVGNSRGFNPPAAIAVVNESKIRDLMMLSSLMEARGLDSGRAAPELKRAYLPEEHRPPIEDDTAARRLKIPMNDGLLKAALAQVSDEIAMPVIARTAFLALPAEFKNSGLDVTDEVLTLLGLSGVSMPIAKKAIENLLVPVPGKETATRKEVRQ
jgi:hypothetical protein